MHSQKLSPFSQGFVGADPGGHWQVDPAAFGNARASWHTIGCMLMNHSDLSYSSYSCGLWWSQRPAHLGSETHDPGGKVSNTPDVFATQ